MANKWSLGLGVTALLALGLIACKPQGSVQKFQKAIAKADTLWACKVDGYPTEAAAQRKDLRYVFGYEVKNVHPLLANEVSLVKAALLDSTTFDTAAVKSCPMVAAYAIAIRKGGKMPWALVMSTSPCGKALVFDGRQAAKPTTMELRLGNKLESIVSGLW